jgi:hypothetical protein
MLMRVFFFSLITVAIIGIGAAAIMTGFDKAASVAFSTSAVRI